MWPIPSASLLPERHELAGMLVTYPSDAAHRRKHDRPNGDVRQVALSFHQRLANRCRVQPSSRLRLRDPINQLNHDVQYGNRQELIVELWRSGTLEQLIGGDNAEPIEGAEDYAAEFGT